VDFQRRIHTPIHLQTLIIWWYNTKNIFWCTDVYEITVLLLRPFRVSDIRTCVTTVELDWVVLWNVTLSDTALLISISMKLLVSLLFFPWLARSCSTRRSRTVITNCHVSRPYILNENTSFINPFAGEAGIQCHSNFLNLRSCLFMETYCTNIYKCAGNRDTLTKVFDCLFYKFFLILSLHFYCTWCT